MSGNPYKPQFSVMKLDNVDTGEILRINFQSSKLHNIVHEVVSNTAVSGEFHCVFPSFNSYVIAPLRFPSIYGRFFSRGFSYCLYLLYFRSRRYPCDCKSFAGLLPRFPRSQLFKSVMWLYRPPDNLQTEPF